MKKEMKKSSEIENNVENLKNYLNFNLKSFVRFSFSPQNVKSVSTTYKMFNLAGCFSIITGMRGQQISIKSNFYETDPQKLGKKTRKGFQSTVSISGPFSEE